MLTVIVTIAGRSIYSANIYCENNDNNGQVYVVFVVIATIMTIAR